MDIKVLGIDLGNTVCGLAGLMKRERLCFANGSTGIGCWAFLLRCRPAWSRRKPAARRSTSGVLS